ncbi:MAG: tetratricopeptide repeat protein [Bacteroidaceae bacterium]|nr:tetratricopeptide repeat protein [Bacteroidaceae bacterium]
MKTARIHIATIMLIFCVSTFAQTVKKPSASSVETIAEKVQALETNTEKQFLLLQEENKVLKDQLQKMESEIALYRDDVRDKVAEMNSNMSNWMTILSIIIGALTAILGIAAPLLLNWTQNKAYKKKLLVLEGKVSAVRKDAESAKVDSNSAKESLEEVRDLKETVTVLKQKIEKSEENAKRAARKAHISKLFAEAIIEHEKDPNKAIELYTKIIAIAKLPEVYNNRALIKQNIGDVNGALEDFNEALVLNPKDITVYNNRGVLKKEQKDYIGSMSDYNRAQEIDPNKATTYNNRADLYITLGKLNEALDDINRCITLDASNPVFFITKGEIYKAMGKYSEAISEFSNALSIKSDIKEAYKYRAECYRELAKNTEDEEKEKEYHTLAEADKKRFEDL